MNEYWIVTEISTGRVVCHCGDINDAIMMVNLDPNKRTYSRYRFLSDQVIDVTSTTDKQLPGQIGLPQGEIKKLNSQTKKIPEGKGQPIIV